MKYFLLTIAVFGLLVISADAKNPPPLKPGVKTPVWKPGFPEYYLAPAVFDGWQAPPFFAPGLSSIQAQMLPAPKSAAVAIHESVTDIAATELAGRGIALPGGRSGRQVFDSDGNEIVWRQVKDEFDARGGRHVLYRQYLAATGRETELMGGGVILHYRSDGTLWAIGGRQFSSVSVENRIAFSALEAVDRVLQRLQASTSFRPESPMTVTAAMRLRRALETELKLVQLGDSFRYAYFTFANDWYGVYHHVVIDAETEKILSIAEVNPRSNCAPSPNWQAVSAKGYPVRGDVPIRQNGEVQAITATDRPSPFVHEAHWNTGIAISILQEVRVPAFQCNVGYERSYTLFPLLTDGLTVEYRDRSEGGVDWRGNAAGDALHHTNQTMQALSALGRNGWDGMGSDANTVLDSTYYGGSDFAFFQINTGGDPRFPSTPTLGVVSAQLFYHPAANLDQIAHEWGHGVAFTSYSANFNPSTSVGPQLAEGFADVVGQAVEKLIQPAGSGPETSSDWYLHEDGAASGYARGAEDDDVTGHPWTGPTGWVETINQTVHREDQPEITQAHTRGNMLNMVFRLLTEGGQNPICGRLSLSGCSTTVSGLGIWMAREILFETLQWYVTYDQSWEQLPTVAGYAAFDLYSNCAVNYSATPEQHAVNQAFTAIGYPRTTPLVRCGQ